VSKRFSVKEAWDFKRPNADPLTWRKLPADLVLLQFPDLQKAWILLFIEATEVPELGRGVWDAQDLPATHSASSSAQKTSSK
jgi:hypothetical protein